MMQCKNWLQSVGSTDDSIVATDQLARYIQMKIVYMTIEASTDFFRQNLSSEVQTCRFAGSVAIHRHDHTTSRRTVKKQELLARNAAPADTWA